MRINIIALILTFGFLSPLTAQYQFQKVVGGDSLEEYVAIVETSEGGFVIGGITGSAGSGEQDALLQKFDSTGMMLWSHVYGGSGAEEIMGMIGTQDGGFTMVGTTWSYPMGNEQAMVIKVDANGQVMWESIFGGSGTERGFSIDNDSDGGYVLIVHGTSWGQGGKDMYVIKTNSQGDLLWQKNLGGALSDRPISIKAYSTGGYILTGYTRSYANERRAFVSRLDTTGTPMWTQTLNAFGDDDAGNDLIETSSGDILAAGIYDKDSVSEYGLLWKLNPAGTTQWIKTYEGSGGLGFNHLSENSDGSYLMSGSFETATTFPNGLIVQTNTTGTVNWSKIYGDSLNLHFHSHLQAGDGGWFGVGESFSSQDTNGSGFIVKTDGNSNSGCNEMEVNLTVSNLTMDSMIVFGIDTNGIQADSSIANSTVNLPDSNHCWKKIVSIEDEIIEDPATAFPNPISSAEFQLHIPNSWGTETQLQIYNQQGRLISQTNVNVGEHLMSLKDSPVGLYFLILVRTDSRTQIIKLLKQ